MEGGFAMNHLNRTLCLLILISFITFGLHAEGTPPPSPSPTPTSGSGTHPLSVDPLPAEWCEPVINVDFYTAPYSNTYVTVTNIETGESYQQFTWTNSSSVTVTMNLYPDARNGFTVEACNDYIPINCTTHSYTEYSGMTVDTRNCDGTPTPVPTMTASHTPAPSTPTPWPTGDIWWTREFTVMDNYTHEPIQGAFIEAQAYTYAYCTTNTSGKCDVTVHAHDTGPIYVTIEVDGYHPFDETYPGLPVSGEIDVYLEPLNPPTHTAVPSTHTPRPSPTPQLPFTPSPSPEPATHTPTPAPTPPECDETGVTIVVSEEEVTAGDELIVSVIFCNAAGEPLSEHPLFFIMEIDGSFWFWPGWVTLLDYNPFTFNEGITEYLMLDFPVPEMPYPIEVTFWSAVTDPDITRIIGTFDVVTVRLE